MGLALLVDHVSERHPAFETWLSETLRRAHARFPRTDPPPEQEPLVPKDFFQSDFAWRNGVAQESLDRFVKTLDPGTNPYLRSPDQMRAAGFTGQP
jgi:hypothetical protein